MAITAFHTWTTGDSITAARLNGNVANILNGGISNYDSEHAVAGSHKAITTSGTITCATGITITAGGLTITAGGQTITDGSLTLTTGNLTLSNGAITVTSGNITITSGNLTLSAGDVDVVGDVSITGDTVASGNLTVSGNVSVTGAFTVSGVSKFKDMGAGVVSASSAALAVSNDGAVDEATKSATFVDATDITVNIKTNGQPVFVALQPHSTTQSGYIEGDSDSVTGSVTNVHFRFVRTTGGATSNLPISSIIFTGASALDIIPTMGIPPSSLWYLDNPPAGDHEYKLQFLVAEAATVDQVHVRRCKLIAFELK